MKVMMKKTMENIYYSRHLCPAATKWGTFIRCLKAVYSLAQSLNWDWAYTFIRVRHW